MENKILQAIENLDKKFEKEIKSVKDEIKSVKDEVKYIKEDIKSVKDEVKSVKEDIKSVKEEVRLVKSQTKENTQILQALMHSVEVSNAKHEGMLKVVMNVQDNVERIKTEVSGLRKDLSTMEVVTANNYADLAKLKAVR